MVDLIGRVFQPSTIPRLRRFTAASPLIEELLCVLGEAASTRFDDVYLAARRSSWNVYLEAAEAIGLLNAEMTARLTSADQSALRSALSECLTAWTLRGQFGLDLAAGAAGRGNRKLDLLARRPADANVNFEVKAPDIPKGKEPDATIGALRAKLDEANEQFESGVPNVAVAVIPLGWVVWPGPLFRALIGHGEIAVEIRLRARAPAIVTREPGERFFRSGAFTKPRANEKPIYTRTGAFLALHETYDGEFKARARIVDNPFAPVQIDGSLFGDAPRYVEIERSDTEIKMGWIGDPYSFLNSRP